MLKNSSLEYMKEMYEKYKDKFDSSLHTVLWHLFVDWKQDDQHCFVQNFKNGGIQLGIATMNERGYTPTLAYFKRGTDYVQAGNVLKEMNADIFNLTNEMTMEIVISSMRENKTP